MSKSRLQNLIVGHTGQDGILLREALNARGESWVGLSGSSIDASDDCPPSFFKVADGAAVTSFVDHWRPEKIYYLAAAHRGSRHSATPDLTAEHKTGISVNIDGPLNFLSAIVECSPNSRLVFASSSLVFAPTDDPAVRINENSLIAPTEPYGVQKLLAGQICQDFRRRRNVHASVAYLFNHESQYRRAGFFVSQVVAGIKRIRARETDVLEIGNLDAIVDWSYAGDVVTALSLIVAGSEPNDYVVASGTGRTIRQFLEVAFRLAGLYWEDHVKVNPALLGRTNSCRVGDASRLREATFWHPATDFQTMIETLIEGGGQNPKPRAISTSIDT